MHLFTVKAIPDLQTDGGIPARCSTSLCSLNTSEKHRFWDELPRRGFSKARAGPDGLELLPDGPAEKHLDHLERSISQGSPGDGLTIA